MHIHWVPGHAAGAECTMCVGGYGVVSEGGVRAHLQGDHVCLQQHCELLCCALV